MDIKTVTVIGVTGTMGANVAGIFASFGDAKVYCVGRSMDKVKSIIPKIAKSVRADSIVANLIPADFSMLDSCVEDSDLIFESCIEDIEVKKNIASRVSENLRENAVSCTGSSGLSITSLAECYSDDLRGNFFGVHMFNPPYSMPLCELISTEYSNTELANELKQYLENKLIRTVVKVKDSPAFLANRIGFQFINEAIQYAEKYKDNGGIDYIDAILGSYTGRSMPPIVTADFVGLDVHKAIVDNLFEHTSDYARDTYILPEFAKKLISEKKYGRKSGEGFYKTIHYENGTKQILVYDINTDSYRERIDYAFPFAVKMKNYFKNGDYDKALKVLVNNHSQEADICLGFLIRYIAYSVYCASKVGYSIESADDVMKTGFNWCPPLALAEALSSVSDLQALMNEYVPQSGDSVDIYRILKETKPSRYDFRPYFKSGR